LTQTENTLLHQLGIGTSSWHWFGRGFLVGLMVIGAANAISYFVLSDGYSNLVGWKVDEQEKIGFPFEVWQRGKTYGSNLIDFPAFYKNGAVGAGLGLIIGICTLLYSNGLNGIAERVLQAEQTSADSAEASAGNQFSIRALMVGTTIVAVIVGLANGSADSAGSFIDRYRRCSRLRIGYAI